MQAVILAGGKGTRLRPFTQDNPKPLFPIQGKPYLDYLLEQVHRFGISSVILLLGYRSEQIIEHIHANPVEGLNIKCHVTPEQFDTGARIRAARELIEEDFVLLYCDNYCPINFSKHVENFYNNKATVQLMAYTNRDGYTKNNLKINRGVVEKYDKDRKSNDLNGVDIGYALVSQQVLAGIPEGADVNFERALYEKLCLSGRLYVTVTEHRYYSIGSYARLDRTNKFFSGQRAVFLDRDGTLNVRPPQACYIEHPEDFIWLKGSMEAIKRLNDAGVLVFLITNQPGLARGRLTESMLAEIHKKMAEDLIGVGAHIDNIYYCPHNWDDGCFCRKPQPGLLYQAQKDYDLNIPEYCILFGDDERDIEAAERADCRGVLVSDEYTLFDAVNDYLLESSKKG